LEAEEGEKRKERARNRRGGKEGIGSQFSYVDVAACCSVLQSDTSRFFANPMPCGG